MAVPKPPGSRQIPVDQGDGPAKNKRAKSGGNAPPPDLAESGVAADELKQFIERIERLQEEKAGIQSDIKDVFAELKGRGFDAKAVRSIIAMRKQDHAERQEQEAILELYMQALGMS